MNANADYLPSRKGQVAYVLHASNGGWRGASHGDDAYIEEMSASPPAAIAKYDLGYACCCERNCTREIAELECHQHKREKKQTLALYTMILSSCEKEWTYRINITEVSLSTFLLPLEIAVDEASGELRHQWRYPFIARNHCVESLFRCYCPCLRC